MSPATHPLSVLRQFGRRPERAERCEFCGAALGRGHRHLFEPEGRQLSCVCDACAVLFPGRGHTRYAHVPRRVRLLHDFRLSDAQWDSLLIPIDLAFLTQDSVAGRPIATYPGPAGSTGSTLRQETWDAIVGENPSLRGMEKDVEALLVNRTGGARDYYLAPIDRCFELTGIIRTHWHGFSGGAEVWREVDRFFAALKEAGHA
jgi:hypothetical protein